MTAPESDDSEDGIYLYGLVDAGALPEGPFCSDGGAPVHALRLGDLAALIREVPLAEFCGPEAEERLRDLAWVGPKACGHEAVIGRAMGVAPAFPVGFATLFRSRAGLAAYLERNHAAIRDFLDRTAGKHEYALKGFAVTDDASVFEALAMELHPDLAGVPPGTRYLLRRRMQPALEAALCARAAERAAELPHSLAPLIHACRALATRPGLEPPGRVAVASLALLVEPMAAPAVREQVERLAADGAAHGLALTLSGPWPPFSFVPRLAAPEGLEPMR